MSLGYAHRLREPNPLHPYSWIVFYRSGGSLRQFDVDGYHRGSDIDRTRLHVMIVTGHPDGSLHLGVVTARGLANAPDTPPDEIILRARNYIDIPVGGGPQARRARFHFGMRWDATEVFWQIDEHGRVSRQVMQVEPCRAG